MTRAIILFTIGMLALLYWAAHVKACDMPCEETIAVTANVTAACDIEQCETVTVMPLTAADLNTSAPTPQEQWDQVKVWRLQPAAGE